MQVAILLLLIILVLLSLITIKQFRYAKQERRADSVHPDLSTQRFDSPLQSLSFEEALTLTPLFENIKVVAERNATRLINAHLGLSALPNQQAIFNGFTAGVNLFTLKVEHGKYLVTFTKEAQKALNDKKLQFLKVKNGNRQSTLVGLDGKFAENATLAGKGQKLLSTVSKLSAVVVSAAHIISAADMAQTLDKITKDIKQLIQVQKNEQLGKLESIFKHAQELMALPLTPEVNMALLNLSKELHELRSAWRRDINCNLADIENPDDRYWLRKKFSRTKTIDRTIASEITESVADFIYIEASMAIHMSLFYALGETDIFFTVSLPNELKQFRETLILLEEKNSYLSSKHPELSADKTIEYFKGFLERYGSLTPALPHQTRSELPFSGNFF